MEQQNALSGSRSSRRLLILRMDSLKNSHEILQTAPRSLGSPGSLSCFVRPRQGGGDACPPCWGGIAILGFYRAILFLSIGAGRSLVRLGRCGLVGRPVTIPR